MSTWVYLIRHGEVEQAADGRFFGRTDVRLSAAGVTQARALARHLVGEPIEAVYTSDLSRARQTAEPLASARRLEPVVRAALREVDMGRWEGLTFREIRERDAEAVARWLGDPAAIPFPDGEDLHALRARVVPAVCDILRAHAGRRIAIVAHGGTNRVILGEALGLALGNVLRLAQDYACWNLLEYRDAGAVVHALNHRLPDASAVPPVERTVPR